MPAQSTLIPQQQLLDAAKAPMLAYNDKNWDAARASLSPDFVYDEIATNRRVQGIDQVIPLWQGWATAFPDSRATFHSELVSGNTAVFEVSWRGTHNGPLETANGPIAATGKRELLGRPGITAVVSGLYQ
ncbi:MAG: ester cyclase [Gemmatimonadales bacterium]